MNQELNEKKEDECGEEEVKNKKEEEEEEEEEEGRAAGSRWGANRPFGSPLGGRAVFHFRKIFNSARQRSRFLIFTYKNIN